MRQIGTFYSEHEEDSYTMQFMPLFRPDLLVNIHRICFHIPSHREAMYRHVKVRGDTHESEMHYGYNRTAR